MPRATAKDLLMSADLPTSDAVGRFGSGRAVPRIEDEGLLKGQGRFTDDVQAAGQLRVAFVRSPYPHARILSIDATAARAMPGVALIATGADLLQSQTKPLPVDATFKRAGGAPGVSHPRAVLAHDTVRFVGEASVPARR
jgi:carbon-monoxide dehydrogenase large subunit